jgi:hypothetical protein
MSSTSTTDSERSAGFVAASTTAPAPAGEPPERTDIDWGEEHEPLVSWPLAGLHLLALWAIAVVQPLFDVLHKNAEFFVARGSTSGDIVAFAIATTVLVPLALLGIELLAGLASAQARDALHLVFVALLVAIFALQLLKRMSDDGATALLLGLSILAGLGAALVYLRTEAARSFASILGFGPPLFLALFLLTSPISELVFPNDSNAKAAAAAGKKAPVVMVVLDEFPVTSLLQPNGRIDAVRFPNLARLSREATWYPNATSVADATQRAVPAIIAGHNPTDDRIPIASEYPHSIFTLLGRSHELHVLESATRICPASLCNRNRIQNKGFEGPSGGGFGDRMRSLYSDLKYVSLHVLLPHKLRSHLPSISEQWSGFGDNKKPEGEDNPDAGQQATTPSAASAAAAAAARKKRAAAEKMTPAQRERARQQADTYIERAKNRQLKNPAFDALLADIKSFGNQRRPVTAKPPMFFAHVFLPHTPWRYLPSGAQYGGPEPTPGLIDNNWENNGYLVDAAWARNMLQIEFTDGLVGKLEQTLRDAKLWDDAVVVVVSDHGGAFVPGQPRRHVNTINVGGIAGVPLFVKGPRQKQGATDPRRIKTMDVLPTIADLLRIRLPWKVDGTAARKISRPATASFTMLRGGVTRGNRIAITTFPWSLFQQRKREVLQRQWARFGWGKNGPGLFHTGPNPQLINRNVLALARAAAGRGRAAFFRANDPLRYVPGSGYSPSHINGIVYGLPKGTDMAIAVNGVVRGVARSYVHNGKVEFSVIVPESAFVAGRNTVAAYAVVRGTRGLALRPLPQTKVH